MARSATHWGWWTAAGVSFGNIGSGYSIPVPHLADHLPHAGDGRPAGGGGHQWTRWTPTTSSPTGKAYQENPRTESEITYQFDLGGRAVYSWVNGGLPDLRQY